MNSPSSLLELAQAFIKTAKPFDFHEMKSWGLNRHNRRRLATKCRQQTLKPKDIPVWLLLRMKHEGTQNG
jgi:hypothetical protein